MSPGSLGLKGSRGRMVGKWKGSREWAGPGRLTTEKWAEPKENIGEVYGLGN